MAFPYSYPIPLNEEERLQEILAIQTAEGSAETSLDEVCHLAQSLFKVPIALATLVGRDEVTFLAKCGVDADGAPRKDAFCSYSILNDEALVVPDMTRDVRFAANPLVTGDMHARFYAGAPLILRPGVRVGTLCLIDTEPRAFSESDAARLKMMATVAVNELRRRRYMIDLQRQQGLLSQAVEMARVGSWILDLKAKSLDWSAETFRIFEVDPEVAPSWELQESILSQEKTGDTANGMQRLIRDGIPFDRELPIVTAKGNTRWVRCIAEAERLDGAVTRVVGSIQDNSAQRRHADEVERLAFRDVLTGLPNRASFQKGLAAAIETAEKRQTKVGLLMLGLDDFKDVNDSLGHDAGDALLRSVAEQLLSVYRGRTDTVARLGGDEFAIVLPNLSDRGDLAIPIERLMTLLRQPRRQANKNVYVSASVGASVYPDDGTSPEEVLKSADIALHRAKAAGRGGFVSFEPAMREQVERRIALLREIRAGILGEQFEMYFQPLVSIALPRAVTGFEALMRWNHPTRGVLGPANFGAGFEDQEISLALGGFALEGVMRQMRAWEDAGIDFGRIAVNLSAAQFRTGDLARTTLARLKHHGLSPGRLTLEVTENVYMGWGSELVADSIRALHEAGIMIALDDFGTGYASLTNLKQFPIDCLKIDRSFTHDLHEPAIVAAVLSLGETMGMKVVAEGVEDAAQLEILAGMGCDQAQGYYFARPMPAGAVPEYLSAFPRSVEARGRVAA